MAVAYVNDKPVDIGTEKLNLIQVGLKAGVFIPHYCWHPGLSVVASCRMCLVEVGDKKPDGTVAMQPKVVPGCQTPAKDGTVIFTNSEKAKAAQQQTLESLLLNHPLDCPVCDKAGECMLQDYTFRYGKASSRMIDDKNLPPNKDYIGEHITLFSDRCIMCSRCVRFTREVAGTAELQIINRGHHAEIDIFPGEPVNNKLAGNVVDLCPVGALCSKDFLYTQRVWFLKNQKSVCPDCSTGCSVFVDHNKDIVYRLRPRENPQSQGYFMCDEGRFDYQYINNGQRLQSPLLRQDNALVATSWDKLVPSLRSELAAAAKRNGAGVAAALSPWLTCEEGYLLARYIKGLSSNAKLYFGPVQVVGHDDTYPKDRKGNPVQPVKFTIRAEKCPNRRGIEEILKHYQGEVLPFEQLLKDAAAGQIQSLYLTGGYSPHLGPWLSEEQGQSFRQIALLVVQDLFHNAATNHAKYVLPASSFAEKDGCFVNHANLVQALHWSVRPAARSITDGQVFLDLLERRGLMHVDTLRQELAKAVKYFKGLGDGDLGEHGVFLEPSGEKTAARA